MIDFSKKLSTNTSIKKLDPIEIYNSLDRASDKGPLRLSQESVLKDWYINYINNKDVILKLHTGQGKTLIGLLILQSKLNASSKPVVYFCPSKLLVDQTCDQAKKFGFKFCKIDNQNQLPQDFLDAKSIFITHVQMLFNGKSKFGLRHNSIELSSIVLDDSHACIDSIQEAFSLKINHTEELYKELFKLFENKLIEQGHATLEEIKENDFNAFLPVPYWVWKDDIIQVTQILSKYRDSDALKFKWDLIKDIIGNCQCIVSGTSIEILPYQNPIEVFSSFYKCSHRIFMSATTNNDAFFIKGLGVETDIVKNPLRYKDEKWSGEKMILIPFLMHEDLNRSLIYNTFGRENPNRNYGIVAVTPSKKYSLHWGACGSLVPDKENINEIISKLKDGNYSKTIVLSNRYDGIDLPDDSCRILILDTKPYASSLYDKLQEHFRENSRVIDIRIAQKVEQGLGRAVRGEKDYCVILITGGELINLVRSKKLKKYFSSQTNKQIEIGIEAGSIAVEQMNSNDAVSLLHNIIKICIGRDENWKQFYKEQMDNIIETDNDFDLLEILQLEKVAEQFHISGKHQKAIDCIQNLIDTYLSDDDKIERAYYLQEIARYSNSISKEMSNKYQLAAYNLNRILLKPSISIEFQKLKIDKKRTENIINWIKKYDNFQDLFFEVKRISSKLSFSSNADDFEKALNELGTSLGFACERPDKELKMGPDNLWSLSEDKYILFECKNEVDESRTSINKSETGQINNSCAWFKSNYPGCTVKNIMIIQTKFIARTTGFNDKVEIIRKSGLNELKRKYVEFFNDLNAYELSTLTESQINTSLNLHSLTVDNFFNSFSEAPIQQK